MIYFNHWLRMALSSQCITPVRAPFNPLTSNAFLLNLSVPKMYLVTYAIISGTAIRKQPVTRHRPLRIRANLRNDRCDLLEHPPIFYTATKWQTHLNFVDCGRIWDCRAVCWVTTIRLLNCHSQRYLISLLFLKVTPRKY